MDTPINTGPTSYKNEYVSDFFSFFKSRFDIVNIWQGKRIDDDVSRWFEYGVKPEGTWVKLKWISSINWIYDLILVNIVEYVRKEAHSTSR